MSTHIKIIVELNKKAKRPEIPASPYCLITCASRLIQMALLLVEKKHLVIGFHALFFSQTAVCFLLLFQITSAQYRFDSFTTDNGLPQNSVRGIAQTPDGYLWFTTFDGLVRYDGAKFTVFDKNNSPGISSNRFTQLHVDKDGTLFAGTEDGGLIVYRDGRFRAFTTVDGLPSNNSLVFPLNRRGEFYIATDAGNCYFRDGKFIPVAKADVLNRGDYYASGTGNFWRLDKNGVRQILPDARETFYALKTEFNNENFGGLEMFEDRAGSLWFGDLSGVYRLNNGEISKFGESAGVPPRTILRPFVEEDDGSIWFAGGSLPGQDIGAVRYKDGKFTIWNKSVGLSSNLVGAIFKDREDTIWMTTYDRGLSHLQKQIVKSLSTGDGLIHSEVYPLIQTRSGDIYIGTTKGVSRFRDGVFTDAAIKNPDGVTISVTALAEDVRGGLWIGANLDLFRLENGKLRRIEAMKGTSTLSIHFDNTGNVWLGTSEGLFILRDEQVVAHFTTADGLPSNDVKFIHEDKNGAIWLGTYGGLVKLTRPGNDKSEISVSRVFTTANGLASDRVRTIYEDNTGVLWIGTYDGGLSRYADGKFFNFTTDNGLFNNGVFQIFEGGKGNFWIGSNRGIYRVNRRELEEAAAGRLAKINSVAYGKQDGMLNAECNGGRQPAGIKTEDGKLWFPTMDGVAIVDPGKVSYNSQPPPVHIETALIERQAVDLKNGITLAANVDNLEIRYTGISFIKPEQMKFRYRIEGLDESWTDVGTIREVYFPSLPAGEYTFHVIAANSDGVWNEKGATIKLSVLPPFWQTSWFIFLIVLCVAAFAFIGYKMRTSQLKRENKRQEAFSRRLIDLQENERKRIAGELHDSLSQNLVIIKNRAVISLEERNRPDQAFQQLEEIADAVTESLFEVREIAHNLRPFQIDRLGLTKAIEALIRKTGTPELTVSTELDEVDGIFSPEMEINLYRILQESLNNIIKHAAASEANVKIIRSGKTIEITIQDNGKGFDAASTRLGESQNGSGFGLFGITERARILGCVPVIESVSGKGTKIYLKMEIKS